MTARQLLDLMAQLSELPQQKIVALARAAAETRRNRDRLGLDDKDFMSFARNRDPIVVNEDLGEYVQEASAFADGCQALLDSGQLDAEESGQARYWADLLCHCDSPAGTSSIWCTRCEKHVP